MLILRLLVVVGTAVMTVITLVVGVAVLLGVGWLAVAIPVVVVVGIIAAGRALWRRYRDGAGPDGE